MSTTYIDTAHLKDVSAIVKDVSETAVALGTDPEAMDDIAVALHEALTNSIIHGYQHEPGYVEIEITREDNDLLVHVRDKAPLFDPITVPAPDISLPLDQRAYGGMGIHMMRNFTDELRYQITNNHQNELILVKKNAFSGNGD